MTNIANTAVSKLFVAFVAAAMLFTFAAPAKAATIEELQAQIAALMAQISSLSGGTSAPAAGCTFTRALTEGAEGADVTCLQNYLTSTGHFTFAGGATGYFGPVTTSAVASWQAANGVSPAVGYFGPVSQAKYSSLMAMTPTTPGTDTSDDVTVGDLSGEADLTDYLGEDADDDTIDEGQDEAEVAVFTVTFENGDASISRLDFSFEGSVNGARPWDAFETASLWVDGDMVAEKDMDSKSDYLGDEDNGIIRFSGLDIVAMEEEDLEIVLAVTVQNGLDTEELTSTWTVTTESLRYFDADGVATTENGAIVTNETAQFTIEEAGENDGASIKKSSDDPKAATLLVEDDSKKSEKFDIFVFNIDVDEDSADLELNDAVIDIKVTNPAGAGTTFGDIVDAVELTVDGKTIKGKTTADLTTALAGGASTTVKYTFDFKGQGIDADDVYEAVVSVVFKGQSTNKYRNGVKVQASVVGTDWELEGTEGDNVLTGSRSGEEHTLSDVVPVISNVTSSVDRNEAGDAGTISFEFTIEADGESDVDFLFADVASVDGTVDSTLFTITGTDLTIATATIAKVSGDAEADGTEGWVITEGDDATFVLDVTFTALDSGDNGAYRVNLASILGVKVDKTSAALNLSK